MYIFQIFKIYYIPSVIILDMLFSYFIIMCIFLQLYYYFGHIILFSIELVNMYIFQIFKIYIFLQLFHYFGYIIQLFLLCVYSFSYFIILAFAFHMLLNAILILLAGMYFIFFSFITLQKPIINGKLSIIACYTWFIIHWCNWKTCVLYSF
jgi:hypothetical protein